MIVIFTAMYYKFRKEGSEVFVNGWSTATKNSRISKDIRL